MERSLTRVFISELTCSHIMHVRLTIRCIFQPYRNGNNQSQSHHLWLPIIPHSRVRINALSCFYHKRFSLQEGNVIFCFSECRHSTDKRSAYKEICLKMIFANLNNTLTSKSHKTCSLIQSQTAVINNSTVNMARLQKSKSGLILATQSDFTFDKWFQVLHCSLAK